MKTIRSWKPTMKTLLSSAILLSFLWSLELNLALAQAAPAPGLPDPNEVPPLGDLPTPTADEPIGLPTTGGRFGGGGVGGGGVVGAGQPGGYYPTATKAYGYHGASAGPAVIIQFSQSDPRSVDTLQEDLNVMSLLLQKKIEQTFGENSPTYRMGIPLLLQPGQRGIESLFLDGFGAVFTLNVNFPLVPPPASKAKERDSTTGSDDWDRARKELYGARETEEQMNPYGPNALPYDAGQVDALKRALLDSLRNAANIRGLKPEDWVVVSVFGTEGVEAGPATSQTPGRTAAPEQEAQQEQVNNSAQQAFYYKLMMERYHILPPGASPTPPTAGGFGGGGGGSGGTTRRPGGEASASDTAPPGAGASWSVSTSGVRTGRETVLIVRVRKSDAESFAKGKMNLDQFEQKATVSAYLGPSTHGSGAFWSGGAYPSRYQRFPAAR